MPSGSRRCVPALPKGKRPARGCGHLWAILWARSSLGANPVGMRPSPRQQTSLGARITPSMIPCICGIGGSGGAGPGCGTARGPGQRCAARRAAAAGPRIPPEHARWASSGGQGTAPGRAAPDGGGAGAWPDAGGGGSATEAGHRGRLVRGWTRAGTVGAGPGTALGHPRGPVEGGSQLWSGRCAVGDGRAWWLLGEASAWATAGPLGRLAPLQGRHRHRGKSPHKGSLSCTPRVPR